MCSVSMDQMDTSEGVKKVQVVKDERHVQLRFGGFNVCRDPIAVKEQALPSRIDMESHTFVHQLRLSSAVLDAFCGDGHNVVFNNTCG